MTKTLTGDETMTTAQAKAKLTSKISSLTTKQLCESFELTNNMTDETLPIVREAIMNELEARNPTAFELWMLCEEVASMDMPSKFYL